MTDKLYREIEAANIMPIAQPTPMVLLQRAMASNASTEVLEKLMALQERWEANQARKAFDGAIADAKAKIPVIRKNRRVGYEAKDKSKPRTDYVHEDMAEIARTVDPVLSEFGLSYRFRVSSKPNEPVSVTCILSHREGHSEETTLYAARDEGAGKNSIQAVGSTVTYLQRYTLKAVLGLAAGEDDDGHGGHAAEDEGHVTAEQVEEIKKLIEEVGAQTEKVCQVYHIESLEQLSPKNFAHAKTKLESFRRQF
jgi:hypothetical protein